MVEMQITEVGAIKPTQNLLLHVERLTQAHVSVRYVTKP